MNKKNILRITGILVTIAVLLTSAVVWSFSPNKDLKPSEENIGMSYQFAMKYSKPSVVLFYADWCTYCMKFMPKYKMLANIYKDKYNFIMVNGDDPHYINLIKDYAIGGFPTIYIIDPSIDNRILISNTLYDNLDRLQTEFDRYLRIRAMIK